MESERGSLWDTKISGTKEDEGEYVKILEGSFKIWELEKNK